MKLAIFDIDGTLTNTNSVDDGCFVRALSEAHAITGINTDWATYSHTTDSGITLQIFREKFGRAPEDLELEKFKSFFVNMLTEEYHSNSSSFTEIPGASGALTRLKREYDWAVAIATGCWRESALLKLRVYGDPVGSLSLRTYSVRLSIVSLSQKPSLLSRFDST